MLIDFSNVAFGYNDVTILQDVTFTVSEGNRVGLIGGNGEGKTTLIKLIMGQLVPDSGTVQKKNGAVFGYLEQNGGFESDKTVYEEMLSVFAQERKAVENLNELAQKLSLAEYGSKEYKTLSAQYERIQKLIDAKDAYNVEVRVKTVLNGMGFEEKYDQVIHTMSGGEKTRLKLCRLLLEEPELLVLDEPTNHLDIKTLFWLEDYLQTFKGAIFVVSHDRYFLDKIVTGIYELERGRLCAFKGNYTKYKLLKAEKVAAQWKEYEKQQEEIAHMEDYVARNLVRATTAKSALSRVKKLESMERIEKPIPPAEPPRFRFTYDTPPYEKVLQLVGLKLTAGERVLLPRCDLVVTRGEKVAVVGDNGTGKSTLIRRIVAADALQGGITDTDPAIVLGKFVRIAYYDQENADLDPNETVLGELWGRHRLMSQTEIRAMLARVKLDEGDVDKKVGSLSGGERAKLALAVFEARHGNFLILDEPTNHLDLQARESLEEALRAFPGTILFVSHDRYFIQAIAGRIVELADGKMHAFTGSYDEYNEYKKSARQQEQREQAEEKEREQKQEQKNKAANNFRTKQERAAEAKRKQRIQEIEKQISELEEEESELNAQIATPQVAKDYKALQEKCARIEAIHALLNDLYAEYETYI